jgi:hypothetical protein
MMMVVVVMPHMSGCRHGRTYRERDGGEYR